MTSRHSSETDGPDSGVSAEVDATFEALSAVERRHALYYLRERDSATLDELATVLAGWLGARGDESAVATPADRERVRSALHHVHLPKLASAGIVGYDLDSGEVTRFALPEFLDATIERSLAMDRERGERFRGAADDWHTRPSMSLRDFLDDAAARERTLTVFAPDRIEGLDAHFETRNVAVEHEAIPDDGSGGFVVLTEDGEFVGSVGAAAVRDLLGDSPPDRSGEDSLGPSDATRALLGLLADTTFVSFDKPQMREVAREIEDRAYREGVGTLRTGFQRGPALAAQRELYESLTAESLLDVHVYVRPDWTLDVPIAEGMTIHTVDDDEIGEFWFVIFDGGRDREQACALVAAERDDSGVFDGFWTYDPETVAELDAYLERTYG